MITGIYYMYDVEIPQEKAKLPMLLFAESTWNSANYSNPSSRTHPPNDEQHLYSRSDGDFCHQGQDTKIVPKN
jgi:hypothetical protein